MIEKLSQFLFGLCILSHAARTLEINNDVEIISGKETPAPNNIIGLSTNGYYGPHLEPAEPTWKASAMLMADEGDGKHGTVSFRQVSPFNPILVNINATGLPKGKHSVHIHAFGDIKEGCKSTGPHVRHILIGNIDVPESGNIDISFYSSYVTLFGHRGIVGRSIVVHEKPIEFNRTPDLYGVPVVSPPVNPVSYQTEEMAVGTSLACGVITITENRQ